MTYLRDTIWRLSLLLSQASSKTVLMLVLMTLVACSSAPRELKLTTVPAEIARPADRPALPDPQPVALRDIEWTVLTQETIPEGDNWVFFGLTPRSYENLSLNQADILRWIEEAMWRLNYYGTQELEDGQ